MKKRIAALALLAVLLLTALAGCSGAEAQDPVGEPDIVGRGITHTIGKHQQIVYRFHAKREPDREGHIYMTLLSADVEEDNQADNRCAVEIGGTMALDAFRAHHKSGLEYLDRWISPSKNRAEWTMEAPYTEMGQVEEADLTITYSRSGKQLTATLEIDGVEAWRAGTGIDHLREDETYLYLFSDQYTLTDVVYEDLGYHWMMPPTLKWVLLAVAVLAGIGLIFFIHCRAKVGDMKLFDIDDPWGLPLFTGGFFLGTAGLALLIYGRSHPDALSRLFFADLGIPLASGGLGFWIPAVICGLLMLGLGGFILAIGFTVGNPLLRLLAGLGLGACHILWYYTVVLIIVQSIETIMAVIMFVVFAVVMEGVAKNSVVKSYHIYSAQRGYIGTVYTLENKDEQDTKK